MAQDTVLVGGSGTVIDLGERNRITGFSRIGGGSPIGQQIAEASAKKRGQWDALWAPDLGN